jgi:pimeloyl-ACP methyl ester carboxylesterase
MNPFFFGSRTRQLFGALHEPAQPATEGVLLCQPAPQQAMRLTWLVRHVAEQLALAGFPALRFDYYGTGDSSGDAEAGTLSQWREDILTAADELRDRSGVASISAIGLRLGATLFASCPELSLSQALLWEPVVDGKSYVRELMQVQAERLERDQLGQEAPETELLGFPFPAREREETLALDLRKPPRCAAASWTLMAGGASPELDELDRALQDEGRKVAVIVDPASKDPSPKSIDSLLYSTAISSALVNAFRQPR